MDNWNALTSNATNSPSAMGGRDTPTGVVKEKLVSQSIFQKKNSFIIF